MLQYESGYNLQPPGAGNNNDIIKFMFFKKKISLICEGSVNMIMIY